MAAKVYIATTVEFSPDGKMTPISLRWEDRLFEIDRVLKVTKAAAQKVGGGGERYTVRINGRERYLFYEVSTSGGGRWFVEKD
ncbi:hypothetical protein FACS1894184_15350 [Clostridia bacterium]|nr:hypothetical protein FACS1894184_15350 [Clostridia bacterium]